MNARTGIILFAAALGGFWAFQSVLSRQPKWTVAEWRAGDPDRPAPRQLVAGASAVKFGNKKVLWAAQAVAGIPLEGSFVKTVEQDSRPVYIKGRYLNAENLPREADVEKQLNSVNALELNRKILKATSGCSQKTPSQAVLRYRAGNWRLIYRAECEVIGGTVELAFNTRGAIVDRRQVAAQFDWVSPSVVIYPKGPVLSALTRLEMPVSAVPSYLVTPTIKVMSDAGLSVQDLGDLSSIVASDPRFDMVQAYYFSTEALKWTEAKLGLKMQGLKLRTHVGTPERRNVAFYHNKEIRIGTGDDVTFANMAWDPTIVVHETMHSVVEALTQMPFQGEGGSLSEALADSLTALQLQTPKMGEASYRSAPYQRTLTDEVFYSQKAGKLYHDSLILSGTVWQVREDAGEGAALDLTVYLLEHLGPSSGFADARSQIQNWFQGCTEGELCDRIGRSLTRRGWL